MIVLDANLLLYAYDASAPMHAKARTWLESILSGEELVGLPVQTVSAFVRITTDTRIPGERRTPEEAARIVDSWFAQPCAVGLAPGLRYWGYFRQMIVEGQARGPLVPDAQLAALAIEHGGVLYTTDKDFARFPGLRWFNPLA